MVLSILKRVAGRRSWNRQGWVDDGEGMEKHVDHHAAYIFQKGRGLGRGWGWGGESVLIIIPCGAGEAGGSFVFVRTDGLVDEVGRAGGWERRHLLN